MFIRTDLFKKCHELAKTKHGQIEQALTSAYFGEKFQDSYYKCSIAKIDALDILQKNAMLVNSDCRLLTNLDVNQGGNPHMGNHNY